MEKVWKAKWIMDREFFGLAPINVFNDPTKAFNSEEELALLPKHKEELKNRHMLVRREFNIKKDFKQAFIDITADDYYKLYINGRFVGQGPAPGYYFNYYYNRFEVTEFLRQGKNIIAVHVYYQGIINKSWVSGDYRQGMIAELSADGEIILCTDSHWKYKIAREFSGETIGYDTQFLENIDSRLKDYGWKDDVYEDNNWDYVSVNEYDDHKLVLQPTPALQIYEVKPQKIIKKGEGHYFIDFGRELVGQLKMEAKGEPGQVVEIRCGEELNEDGSTVRFEMRCNCTYREFWTLSGDRDILEYYDYKAFRYAEVIATRGVINPDSIFMVVRHYPFDHEKCKFKSSEKLLNDIWEICKNGVIFGSQEGFLDTPNREKGQYLGDITITGKSHVYLSGDHRLFRKALSEFAMSSFICPSLMTLAPSSFMLKIADSSLLWPLQLLYYYNYTGDMDFLKQMYPKAEGLIRYFDRYKREDGLIENVKDMWNLVDWPANLRDGYDFDLSTPVPDGCHNVINAFYLGAVKTINQIRDILDIAYHDELPSLKEAYIRAFFQKDTGLFRDSTVSDHCALHSNVIPLFYDLVPEEAVKSIVGLIKEKKFSCGVYIAYFLLKGLARVGEYELVYELITSEDEKSWANMLREGATTCFEAWGKDLKWNTSLCHPWASAPISILIEDIIGLSPAVAGWSEVSFKPHIPEELSFISLELSVPAGKIKVHYEDKTPKITFSGNIKLVTE